ncbi:MULTISPECIES: YopX family protein [Bacillus amyloliquefaciens group]|uniref:YopX family protein n=1 Tax=Bacillus amyloliquefaciens group TaxID=1938374 RepID=UPI00073C192A|nr:MULTISPECIES: YopX family protein [Bacillus amyloliquefaciens group]KTF59726.1 hypothetical protein AR691_13415 [Bacillus amyloliquefaciens]
MNEYRVWDGKKMYYWDDLGMSLEIKGDKWILWHTLNDGSEDVVVESDDKGADLMWGIGLGDKNEKRIYEKDIDMANGEPMIVARVNGNSGLRYPSDPSYYIDDCILWRECNIGGNVYQHPELLGVQNEIIYG